MSAQDLGQQLIDFLHHYAHFDFATMGLSLSDGYFQRDPGTHASPLVVVSPFNPEINLASAAFAMPNVARMFHDAHRALTDRQFAFLAQPPALAERNSRLRCILRALPDSASRRMTFDEIMPPDSPRRSSSWDPQPWQLADEYT